LGLRGVLRPRQVLRWLRVSSSGLLACCTGAATVRGRRKKKNSARKRAIVQIRTFLRDPPPPLPPGDNVAETHCNVHTPRRSGVDNGTSKRSLAGTALEPMEAAVNSARRRLLGLEDRIPWNAVKKSWAATQQKWKNIVTSALDFNALAQELLVLESMLTSNSMAPDWQSHKAAWIMRVKQCAGPAVLEQLVGVLENTIQWHRILVAPDGRPLSAEELASGQFGVGGFPPTPLPPPLSLTLTARANGGAGSSGAASPSTVPDPPDGVPRAAARMQMLLLAMGAKDYDPKVVVQLLDVMYVWTASVLNDASLYARMRVLGSDSATRQHTLQLAMAAEPPIEEVDVVLAVRGRAEHLWTSAAARDVIAQQAADINTEPMPILPRQPVVTLPTDLSQCLPCAHAAEPRP